MLTNDTHIRPDPDFSNQINLTVGGRFIASWDKTVVRELVRPRGTVGTDKLIPLSVAEQMVKMAAEEGFLRGGQVLGKIQSILKELE